MTPEQVEQLIEAHRALVDEQARRFGALAHDPDLLQCGMIGLWRAAEHWDGVRPFPALARTCIRNAMLSHLRTLQRWGPTPDPAARPEPEDPTAGEDQRLDRLDLTARIRAAFPGSSVEGYVLLALSHGVSKCAVAAALGMDTYQVTKLARKAWKKIAPSSS